LNFRKTEIKGGNSCTVLGALQGEGISAEVRIIVIADSYNAMTSDRTYGKALSQIGVIKEIKEKAEFQFNPDILKIFI